jgi:hypothetical protein
MRRLLPILGSFLALAFLAPAAQAQEEAATHAVVRFFKCSPQGAGIRALQQARPIADEMVAEGKFVAYGVLAHNWGDEWNVVDYFNVNGIDGFFANFSEFVRRASEAAGEDNEIGQAFAEACTEHKDVIYGVVPPPSGN